METASLNSNVASDIEHSVSCQVLTDNPYLANTGNRSDARRVFGLWIDKRGDLYAILLRSGESCERRSESCSALGDDFLKEVAGKRRGHQHAGVDGACGLAEYSDIVGVTTELCDVFMDPLQGEDLIQEAVVAGGVLRRLGGERWMSEKAEDAEAVIDCDDNPIGLRKGRCR